MPIRIKRLVLNKMELLSVVDRGGSGDDDSRPSIVLYKRKKTPTETKTMPKATKKDSDAKTLELAKAMGLGQIVASLDEAELSDAQKPIVLKLLELAASGAKDPEAAPPPPEVAKADDDPAEDPKELEKQDEGDEKDEEEKKEMAKRNKAHAIELKKRDDEIKALSKSVDGLKDDAQTLRLEKRADELEFLPGFTREETIELLKRFDGDEKALEAIIKLNKVSAENPILKAAGLVVKEDENSPHMRLAKRKTVLMDKNPEMSAADATALIFKNDEDLYKEIKAAQQ